VLFALKLWRSFGKLKERSNYEQLRGEESESEREREREKTETFILKWI
jgi:hypothetical protein